ncbi:Xylose isomerase-like TIM barrel [Rubripirellula tenax]|uniref:Xylose isomerase-like TIM barrel n=1 Tax=Rubripirellula tenax TaxID=2528015 RepID=A0A5C6FJY8_9BACT|nr:sugar phosphate isomerase/epimerase family protein [Rubripirellula tenax]TWU60074.1 Xylose isomerase-like TIM barrel [Rubripirellula tenax]
MSSNPSRRDFFAASLSCVAVASSTISFADEGEPQEKNSDQKKICVFTKPLNSMTFDAMADALAEAGFDAIEAPVRKGGNVEPETVEDDLPRLVEALAKHGMTVAMLTTDINDASDPLTERVLRTAATLGVTKYRMQYLRYDRKADVVGQIEAWKPQLRDLAAMNHDFGVQGLYQNHAGNQYFGSAIWDLHLGLDGIDPSAIGVAYDLRHAMAEAGMSWPVSLELIRPKIAAMYIKDFRWDGDDLVNVPLGEGRVDREAVKSLHLSAFDGPISLHEEYLDHKKPELVPQHLAAMKSDLETLRSWIAS